MARNGLEAVQQAERLRPDVIVMDVHMPRMDGYEATRQIMERVPTPIVIVSASSGRQEVAAARVLLVPLGRLLAEEHQAHAPPRPRLLRRPHHPHQRVHTIRSLGELVLPEALGERQREVQDVAGQHRVLERHAGASVGGVFALGHLFPGSGGVVPLHLNGQAQPHADAFAAFLASGHGGRLSPGGSSG